MSFNEILIVTGFLSLGILIGFFLDNIKDNVLGKK